MSWNLIRVPRFYHKKEKKETGVESLAPPPCRLYQSSVIHHPSTRKVEKSKAHANAHVLDILSFDDSGKTREKEKSKTRGSSPIKLKKEHVKRIPPVID